MKFELTQKEDLEYKGFKGTVFYYPYYDLYFGWVKGVKGLLYYEYEDLDHLTYKFQWAVDDFLKLDKKFPLGYTNIGEYFELLTESRTYEELSDSEREYYNDRVFQYHCWQDMIAEARNKAKEAGKDYHYLRSIAEIHDSAFDVAHLTTSYHIAERLLAKGVDPEIVKEACRLTDKEMSIIS